MSLHCGECLLSCLPSLSIALVLDSEGTREEDGWFEEFIQTMHLQVRGGDRTMLRSSASWLSDGNLTLTVIQTCLCLQVMVMVMVMVFITSLQQLMS